MNVKILIGVIFLLLSIGVFSSCRKGTSRGEDISTLRAENAELKTENARLKNENEGLKKELEKLRTTADFVYREGVDLMNGSNYEGAKEKFLEVVNKYPNSEYDGAAKERLGKVNKEIAKIEEERRRAEREAEEKRKYEPRTEDEARAEWRSFRKDEKSMLGTITTWRFQVDYISNESPKGHIGRYVEQKFVCILGPEGWTYLAAAAVGKVPVIKEDDWVCVTGRFYGVSSDGVVLLTPIRVINEGYR
jgi:hypothetical protein